MLLTISPIAYGSTVRDGARGLIMVVIRCGRSSVMIHFIYISMVVSHSELWGGILEIERRDMYGISWCLRHVSWLDILHYRLLSLERSSIIRQLISNHVWVWSIVSLWLYHVRLDWSLHQMLIAKTIVRNLSRQVCLSQWNGDVTADFLFIH